MKKRMIFSLVSLLMIVGLFFVVKSIRYEHYPIPVEPSETWEPYVNSLNAQREAFFVESDGIKLEAELFIPNGGGEKKPAVVFAPGSGDSLYQNYSPGLIETYILNLFLSRDFAVLLVNKRGMGQSEGNYVKNSIEGRADDLYASVHFIQKHPNIDPKNVGVIGHSQGGWVAVQAASEHPDIAFFISLAGPTVTMRENSLDNQYHYALCQGMQGEELDEYLANRQKMIDVSIAIGNLTNFGFFGFDARNMDYDPHDALLKVESPGLYVFAENDALVTPALNIKRMEEIFDGNAPARLNTIIMDSATHGFRIVNNPCEVLDEQPISEELVDVLNNWLVEQGY